MTPDTEKFRFRRYLESMADQGEIDVDNTPTPLSTVAGRLEGNPQGVWFRRAGPDAQELAGNIMGSRRRLALSLGVAERDLLAETTKRLRAPVAPVEIASADAPVHQVIQRDNEADLTALPVHLQHGQDGAPYISATLDFSRDPATGHTNVGMRRLMLRGRREAGIDLNAPSDLRAIYSGVQGGGDRLPVAFAVGYHPADAIAALAMTPPVDELALMGAVRGAPVPVVKCVTSDLLVPADAEYIIEGYLDANGWTEPEGPYGEYVGYYGRLKQNPVFHLTAITRREDAVFQTATIGGRNMATTDTAQLCSLRTEQAVWTALESAVLHGRDVQYPHRSQPAGAGRIPERHRGGIRVVRGYQACLRRRFRYRRVQRQPDGMGARHAFPGRSRPRHVGRIPCGAAGPVAAGKPGRRESGVRPDPPLRPGRGPGMAGPRSAGFRGKQIDDRRRSAAGRAEILPATDGSNGFG